MRSSSAFAGRAARPDVNVDGSRNGDEPGAAERRSPVGRSVSVDVRTAVVVGHGVAAGSEGADDTSSVCQGKGL
jgi:hypothetical protein